MIVPVLCFSRIPKQNLFLKAATFTTEPASIIFIKILLVAKMVSKMEDWEYSSFKDYCGFRNGTLANKELAIQLLDLNMKTFYEDSYKIIDDDELKNFLCAD